jgi:hypothetical protein
MEMVSVIMTIEHQYVRHSMPCNCNRLTHVAFLGSRMSASTSRRTLDTYHHFSDRVKAGRAKLRFWAASIDRQCLRAPRRWSHRLETRWPSRMNKVVVESTFSQCVSRQIQMRTNAFSGRFAHTVDEREGFPRCVLYLYMSTPIEAETKSVGLEMLRRRWLQRWCAELKGVRQDGYRCMLDVGKKAPSSCLGGGKIARALPVDQTLQCVALLVIEHRSPGSSAQDQVAWLVRCWLEANSVEYDFTQETGRTTAVLGVEMMAPAM